MLRQINKKSLDLEFLAHGEICAGGLPRTDGKITSSEDHSAFLFGRTRLSVGYERKWLEAKVVLQNKAVWGMKNNMSLNMYEGWVKMKAKIMVMCLQAKECQRLPANHQKLDEKL